MTTFRSAFNPPRAFAFCAVLSLAACDSAPGPLGNMFGGDKPAEGVTETLPRPQPDARGVITYANYQVIVAREGDDISSIAARVGLEPSELARHNGLPGGYRPRTGEVLALPRDVGGTPATYGGVAASGSPTASGAAPADAGALWSSDIAATAIDTAETAPQGANPFANGQSTTVIDPKRHRVVRGETAFSIARTHGVSVQALGEWNGLGPDYALRDGQELLIPVSDFKPVEREVASLNPPGTPTPIAPPPSAAAPLPEDQNVADVVRPASPNLGTERTEASLSPNSPEPTPAPAPTSAPIATAAFGAPVAGARVLRPYDPTGPNKNEGIDFA
ncbi:MAG: LysM domain-containing protein, partial [Pseudomonadota bacterium]